MANIPLTVNLKVPRGRGGFLFFPKNNYALNFTDWVNTQGEEVLQDLNVVDTSDDRIVHNIFTKRTATVDGTPDENDITNQAALDTYNTTRATLRNERNTLRDELDVLRDDLATAQTTLADAQAAEQVLTDSGTATQAELDAAGAATTAAVLARNTARDARNAKANELQAKQDEIAALVEVLPDYKIKNKYEDAILYLDNAGAITPEGITGLGDYTFSKTIKLSDFIV